MGGHCKSMKPAWDSLMEEFADSKTALVADVDCTVEEALCSTHGVQGYPTIKHGSQTQWKTTTVVVPLKTCKPFPARASDHHVDQTTSTCALTSRRLRSPP